MKVLRRISAPGRWCVHSYYTLVPYAPDGSGRLLLAGADMKTRLGKVYVIGADGKVEDEFGESPVETACPVLSENLVAVQQHALQRVVFRELLQKSAHVGVEMHVERMRIELVAFEAKPCL